MGCAVGRVTRLHVNIMLPVGTSYQPFLTLGEMKGVL